MHNDILKTEKPLVGRKIGKYNRSFVIKFKTMFEKSFGKGGSSINKMSLAQLIEKLNDINQEIKKRRLFSGPATLD